MRSRKRVYDDGEEEEYLNGHEASMYPKLSVLTYNVFCRPPLIHTNGEDYKNQRLEDLFCELDGARLARYDVICLQELFGLCTMRRRRVIEWARKLGFCYYTHSQHPRNQMMFCSDSDNALNIEQSLSQCMCGALSHYYYSYALPSLLLRALGNTLVSWIQTLSLFGCRCNRSSAVQQQAAHCHWDSTRLLPVHLIDGGCMILSRYPIVEQKEIVFAPSTGFDRLAMKGCLFARICVRPQELLKCREVHLLDQDYDGCRACMQLQQQQQQSTRTTDVEEDDDEVMIDVYNAHLQSEEEPENCYDTRCKQLCQIREFVECTSFKQNMPFPGISGVVLCGDFNMNGQLDQVYELIQRHLNPPSNSSNMLFRDVAREYALVLQQHHQHAGAFLPKEQDDSLSVVFGTTTTTSSSNNSSSKHILDEGCTSTHYCRDLVTYGDCGYDQILTANKDWFLCARLDYIWMVQGGGTRAHHHIECSGSRVEKFTIEPRENRPYRVLSDHYGVSAEFVLL